MAREDSGKRTRIFSILTPVRKLAKITMIFEQKQQEVEVWNIL